MYTEEKLTLAAFIALPDLQKQRVSRIPLDADTIQSLINTAIEMHSRALQHQQERRWWIPLVFSGIGGLIGLLLRQ